MLRETYLLEIIFGNICNFKQFALVNECLAVLGTEKESRGGVGVVGKVR